MINAMHAQTRLIPLQLFYRGDERRDIDGSSAIHSQVSSSTRRQAARTIRLRPTLDGERARRAVYDERQLLHLYSLLQ